MNNFERYVTFLNLVLAFPVRFLAFAGFAYCMFYIFRKKKFAHLKLQSHLPKRGMIFTEITYSTITMCIYAVISLGLYWLFKHGHTAIYTSVNDLGVLYFVLSILFLLVFQDGYFYWVHRLLHRPFFFKYVHRVHHLSHNPSPFAAFSFHPIEGILNGIFLPGLAIFIPFHPIALVIFMFIMMIHNIAGHLGYEVFSKKYRKSKIGRWQMTATHHDHHHKYSKENYGLYFNFWDKYMRTGSEE